MAVRILIISNLCLLAALIFALNRSPDQPAEEISTQRPRIKKEVSRQSEAQVLSALPKARRNTSRRSRLANVERLLKQIQHMDRSALIRLHSEFMAKGRAGMYDTKIERQLIDYKIGEVGGDDPTRGLFPWPDGGVYARALIVEGWAHGHPTDALTWWAKLDAGKRRDSLLPPLVRGYLSAEGTAWSGLVEFLTPDELNAAAIPMLEAAVDKEDSADLIELFEDEFGQANSKQRYRLAGKINDHLCEKGSYEDLKNWYQAREAEREFWLLTGDRYKELVRALAVKGGANSFEFLPETVTMSAARAWVRAESFAAGKWLKNSPRKAGAEEVAFYLAIENVTSNTDKSREWAEFISDEHLAETIDEIISGYEDR